ncbi:hypothetical protein ACFYQA_08545 [Streptomyces sp. NPDC005774]|uniref:hypothetical protein n=1 Tax=Streptomyces sp. NPDC005774 TaxID=3364728 RepID=UPI0036A21B6B
MSGSIRGVATGVFRIIAEVANADGAGDASYASGRVGYALEEYGYEATVWVDADAGDELAAFRALELGALNGRVSASCIEPGHPTWLRAPDDTRGCPWCRIAELEAEEERAAAHTEHLATTLVARTEDLMAPELEAAQGTVYRASHDSIVMGLYTTREAAMHHCEAAITRDPFFRTCSFFWAENEDGGVWRLTAESTRDAKRATDYRVTALEVASEYDEEADE